jgi:hypothetical protein
VRAISEIEAPAVNGLDDLAVTRSDSTTHSLAGVLLGELDLMLRPLDAGAFGGRQRACDEGSIRQRLRSFPPIVKLILANLA